MAVNLGKIEHYVDRYCDELQVDTTERDYVRLYPSRDELFLEEEEVVKLIEQLSSWVGLRNS